MRTFFAIALLFCLPCWATTYYVDPLNGVDGAAGTSFGAAWATLQKALDTATAGDEVRLCKTATETTIATVDIDVQNGTLIAPIRIFSYNSAGTAREAGYTLQAIATWGGCEVVHSAIVVGNFLRFFGIIFDANDLATNAFDDNETSSGANAAVPGFEVCQFRQATGDGYESNNPKRSFFLDCVFDNNGGDGYASQTLQDGIAIFIGCVFHNNITFGCFMDDGGTSFLHCEFWKR